MSVLAATPLALTIGDPAGIGPDITLLAFDARRRERLPPFVFLGDKLVLESRAAQLGLKVRIETITSLRTLFTYSTKRCRCSRYRCRFRFKQVPQPPAPCRP